MSTVEQRTSVPGGPTWEIAQLFPNQGMWTVGEYLALNGNHLVEFSDGVLEVLPMPSETHQLIVLFLYRTLFAYAATRGVGTVLTAPLRVKLWEGKFREPDIVFLLAENAARRGNKFWRGADLVMEVVSEDDPQRDLDSKRTEYAQAGIREYWIVDPHDRTITVLTLGAAAGEYSCAGRYNCGDTASSVLLASFAVDVTPVFSQS
jgi:Uma2 family endonuclease